MELHETQQSHIDKSSLQTSTEIHRRPSTSDNALQRRSLQQTDRPPSILSTTSPKWNSTPLTTFRILTTFYALFTMGFNDAACGALILYLERHYNLSYTVVSLIFLSPFIGYVLAALSNNTIHNHLGQRGIAILGPTSKMVAYTVICNHPPYGVLVLFYAFVGYGVGIGDAGWNAYVGDMADANQLLGFLHGFYGLGATVSPLVATALITKLGWPWWRFYYFMLGGVVLELGVGAVAFWRCDAAAFRASVAVSAGASQGATDSGATLKSVLLRRPAARVTWLCAVFLLGYVGVEVALGGWIVVFMSRIRGGTHFASGIVATGFWAGITLGRVVLGFVTPRLGEKLAIMIYLPIVMGLQLCFWLIPSFVGSAIFVALEGFFLGPLFPAAVVAMTKLLPKHLHVSALGFATAFGGCGAAVFPFMVGAVANATSVKALQPMVLGMLCCVLAAWCGLPRMRKRD